MRVEVHILMQKLAAAPVQTEAAPDFDKPSPDDFFSKPAPGQVPATPPPPPAPTQQPAQQAPGWVGRAKEWAGNTSVGQAAAKTFNMQVPANKFYDPVNASVAEAYKASEPWYVQKDIYAKHLPAAQASVRNLIESGDAGFMAKLKEIDPNAAVAAERMKGKRDTVGAGDATTLGNALKHPGMQAYLKQSVQGAVQPGIVKDMTNKYAPYALGGIGLALLAGGALSGGSDDSEDGPGGQGAPRNTQEALEQLQQRRLQAGRMGRGFSDGSNFNRSF